MAEFFMFFARCANFNEERDSLKASKAGEIIAIIVVLQFPPKESSRSLVSFLKFQFILKKLLLNLYMGYEIAAI